MSAFLCVISARAAAQGLGDPTDWCTPPPALIPLCSPLHASFAQLLHACAAARCAVCAGGHLPRRHAIASCHCSCVPRAHKDRTHGHARTLSHATPISARTGMASHVCTSSHRPARAVVWCMSRHTTHHSLTVAHMFALSCPCACSLACACAHARGHDNHG